jgi:short subunit dehydrogenase-like uncharacterized protein
MITLFGATGYTGTLIAQALDRQNLTFRIAGRSDKKLRDLSAHLRSHPTWLTADATRPETLPYLFKDTRVLINCAGPFTDLGEKVASLAAVNGVHYLDTTNELGYVYRLRTYASIAEKTGAALVPACAFEVALADCAASLLAQKSTGKTERIDVVYHLTGSGSSRGTRLSALRSLATSWLSFQGNAWIGSAPGSKRSQFNLSSGVSPVVSFPSSESVTLACHLSPMEINTWMTASRLSSYFAPLFVPLFARFLRSLPGRSVLWAAGLRPASMAKNIRTRAPFEVLVALKDEHEVHTVSITGTGAYEVTAEIIVLAVQNLLSPDFKRNGFLAPAQILDPSMLFTQAGRWGVKLSPFLIGAVGG